MDPQQRLLLEVVYEALEDGNDAYLVILLSLLTRDTAGIPIQSIDGSQTSVFCGCFTNDHNAMTTKDLLTYPKYTVTGTGNSILANRISYSYNLHRVPQSTRLAPRPSYVSTWATSRSATTSRTYPSLSAPHFTSIQIYLLP